MIVKIINNTGNILRILLPNHSKYFFIVLIIFTNILPLLLLDGLTDSVYYSDGKISITSCNYSFYLFFSNQFAITSSFSARNSRTSIPIASEYLSNNFGNTFSLKICFSSGVTIIIFFALSFNSPFK